MGARTQLIDSPLPAAADGIADFTLRRVERALRERLRYRYVRPRVWREDGWLRIDSPCCSRNVDPQGGVIDIARLRQLRSGTWRLESRDHVAVRWVVHARSQRLDELLDLVCVDSERVFWP